MARSATRSPAPLWGLVGFSVILIVVGVFILGTRSSATPPTPPTPAHAVASEPVTQPPSASPLATSRPVHMTIPSLHVSAPIVPLGLEADGTVQVPPIEHDAPVGWYKDSPTPGAAGASVLLGHSTVGSYGKGAFFRLGELTPGARIDVTRADGSTAHFTVRQVAQYPKASFPSRKVYEGSGAAELRLITCAGGRDAHYEYLDNIVVYAALTAG